MKERRPKQSKRDLQALRNQTHQGKRAFWVFSPFLRLFHWTMVLSVFVLFATGLYIGDPGFGGLVGTDPTFLVASSLSMSFIRKVHFIAAAILIASLVLRIYGAFRYKGDRLFPHFHKKSYWTGLVWSIKHYLFLPHDEREYVRNPLARTAYFTIYLALVAIILTGLCMYVQVRPESVLAGLFAPLNKLIPEYFMHIIHHAAAWYFMIFVVVHVYMAFRADYLDKDGELSSMISGYKFYDHLPVDIAEIDPEAACEAAEHYHKAEAAEKINTATQVESRA